MTVSAASALNVTGTDTDAINYTTASWTPVTGMGYLFAIAVLDLGSARTAAVSWTVTGNNMTWTLVGTQIGGATEPALAVFRAYNDGTATAGAITVSGVVTAGQTADGAVWGIAELSGIPSASFRVQNAGNTASADSVTATLGAFSSTRNATCAWVMSYDNASTTGPAITAGSGFSIVSGLDAGQAMGGDGTRLTFEFRSDNDTSVDATAVAANDRMHIIAVELLSGAAGTATITGSGAIDAAGVRVASRTATFSGSGLIDSTGVRVCERAATIAADATVSATGLRITAAAATIAGSATLTGTAIRITFADATVDGSGAVDATGNNQSGASSWDGTATLAGAGAVDAAGAPTRNSTATLDGAGTVDASGYATRSGSATIAATTTVDATGSATGPPSATITGTGTVAATGVRIPIVDPNTPTGNAGRYPRRRPVQRQLAVERRRRYRITRSFIAVLEAPARSALTLTTTTRAEMLSTVHNNYRDSRRMRRSVHAQASCVRSAVRSQDRWEIYRPPTPEEAWGRVMTLLADTL